MLYAYALTSQCYSQNGLFNTRLVSIVSSNFCCVYIFCFQCQCSTHLSETICSPNFGWCRKFIKSLSGRNECLFYESEPYMRKTTKVYNQLSGDSILLLWNLKFDGKMYIEGVLLGILSSNSGIDFFRLSKNTHTQNIVEQKYLFTFNYLEWQT